MANFYSDKPELKFHLENDLMKRIVELREGDFSDRETYDYAPVDYNDAIDNYNRVLSIVGDITALPPTPRAWTPKVPTTRTDVLNTLQEQKKTLRPWLLPE